MPSMQSLQLSANELRTLTKWSDPVLYQFLSVVQAMQDLPADVATAIEEALVAFLLEAHTWADKQTFNDYTVLGDASVKVKKLTGTTDAVAGNTASVAHGIDPDSIISITAVVNDGTTVYCPCSPVAADEYSITADATDVNVTNGASATTILARPFVVTVIYGD
jgi:hypothetical protein